MNELQILIGITSIICLGVLLGGYYLVRGYKYAMLPPWIASLCFIMISYRAGKSTGMGHLGTFLLGITCTISSLIAALIITIIALKVYPVIYKAGVKQMIIYCITAFLLPIVLMNITV